MTQRPMTIGKLSKATGVSIRTLRHYDEIELLTPATSTEAGYRLYGAGDIERLQQIRSLQALGFSLEQITGVLRDAEPDLGGILEQQLVSVDQQVDQHSRLRSQLSDLLAVLRRAETVAREDLLALMKEMKNVEKYYTNEQLDTLARRRANFGDNGMHQAENQWAALIDNVRNARNAGLDPASPRVRELSAE